MTQPVITADGLGKAYRLGAKEEAPDTLMAAARSLATAPLRNFRELSRLNTFGRSGEGDADGRTLWALRDVSFGVEQGDVVGVIGRNGAGKSTLLKVLSRITEPTTGRAVIRGRVSSLLEVGTGFHPELSGRDNVYMNGTILGMTKREIDRKFDEIVAFSGVERFLDTPIKRYSSGMQVRLAFAVAAHLEPEILIVDEVLAVGDMEFQKKCLGKMKDVASSGRTVLLVSHNMAAVRSMSTAALLLDQGRLVYAGEPDAALRRYHEIAVEAASQDLSARTDRGGSGRVRVRAIAVETPGSDHAEVATGAPITLRIALDGEAARLWCLLSVYDRNSNQVANFSSRISALVDKTRPSGPREFVCHVESLPLRPGEYYVNAAIGEGDSTLDHVTGAVAFSVLPSSAMPIDAASMPGLGSLWPTHRWNTSATR